MAYEEMKCRKCGKPIQFAEGAPWIRCVYCGAEYTRTAKKEKAGEVQPIGNGGNPLFEAFLPAGWTYRIIEDGSFSSLAPACLGIAFTGPSGVQMTFLPFAYYKDAAVRANPFSPQSVPGEQFDGMSLVRYRKRAALPQYAYERIAAITKTTQLRVEPMDAGVLKERQPGLEGKLDRSCREPYTPNRENSACRYLRREGVSEATLPRFRPIWIRESGPGRMLGETFSKKEWHF